MLSTIKAIVPEKLIFLAQKTPKIPVAIVCAHHASAIESAKQACDLNLIEHDKFICFTREGVGQQIYFIFQN